MQYSDNLAELFSVERAEEHDLIKVGITVLWFGGVGNVNSLSLIVNSCNIDLSAPACCPNIIES